MRTRTFVHIAFALLTAAPALAQELPEGNPMNPSFREHFVKVVAANESVRNFHTMLAGAKFTLPDGTVDTLKADEKGGIWEHEFAIWYGYPYSELKNQTAAIAPPAPPAAPAPVIIKVDTPDYQLLIAALAVAFILAAVAFFLANRLVRRREREEAIATAEAARQREVEAAAAAIVAEEAARQAELHRNPVTSGPPIIEGGVEAGNPEALARAMDTGAVSDYVRLNPGVARETVRVERIGPIEVGMISGTGMVGYADHARARTIDPALAGYRARFRFQDGRESLLMSLQGCMNPCYYGEGLTGFTFVASEIAVPVPEPPAPPVEEPLADPLVAVQRIRTTAIEAGESTVSIGDQIMTFSNGVHLTVDEGTGVSTISDGRGVVTVTVRAKRRKTARPRSLVAATATA